MAGESPVAFAGPGIPDFGHAVLGAGDDSQRIGCQGPDTLDMAEVCPQAFLGRRVPEADR